MKKGYKRLLFFEAIFLLLFILISFISNFLDSYYSLAFFLALGLVIFKFRFGFKKKRTRYVKDVIFAELVYLLFFFLFYYLLGFIIGFTRTINYYTTLGIFKIIFPLIILIIIKEFFRYQMIYRSDGSKVCLIMTCILFITLDVGEVFFRTYFSGFEEIFKFIALYLLPVISCNIACCYISYKVGYVPSITFLLIWTLYSYLVPIIPDVNNYLYSVINIVIPAFIASNIYRLFQKNVYTDYDEVLLSREKKRSFGGLLIPTVIIIVLVYFTSGYFKYQAIAIASGSMVPSINVGDVVIINKVNDNFKEINEGDIIAFRKNNIIIVHRLIRKLETEDECYYYTQGDANKEVDNFQVTTKEIIGKVNIKIPIIGLPTVWLSKLNW